MTRLVVSGDDFGIHKSINAGIEKAHREGILTSASLVATGADRDDALRIVRSCPDLKVGLHFALVDEEPAAPLERVRALVGEDGRLFSSHFVFARKVLTGAISEEVLRLEFDAQMGLLRDAGLHISHVDGHRHLHMLPPVQRAMAPVLKRFGVHRMRLVRSPLFEMNLNPIKLPLAVLFHVQCRVSAAMRRIVTTDRFIGFFGTGNLGPQRVMAWLRRLRPDRSYEIAFHPGVDDDALRADFSRWAQYFDYQFSWRKELETLTSPAVAQVVRERDIRLISYAEL